MTTTAGAGLSDQQQADLERYLDATRAELLFARLAMLVEGDADRYIVPALARAADFDLDEYGISVISVQGTDTDFAPFRMLLGRNGLDIPHFVITDGDRTLDPYPATSDGLLRGLRLLDTDTARAAQEAFPEHPAETGTGRYQQNSTAAASSLATPPSRSISPGCCPDHSGRLWTICPARGPPPTSRRAWTRSLWATTTRTSANSS